MSIATAISDLSSRIQDVYDVCESKGAILPDEKNTYNLSSTVDSLVTEKYGVTLHDLFGKEENYNDMIYLMPSDEKFGVDFNGVEGISGEYQLAYKFCSTSPISSINFPDLKHLGERTLYYICYDNQNLSSINFPQLEDAESYSLQYAFRNSNVSSAYFPKLKHIGQNGVQYSFYTTPIKHADFPLLSDIGERSLYNAFYGCTSLTSFSLPNIKEIPTYGLYQAFKGCTSLSDISDFTKNVTSISSTGCYSTFADTAISGEIIFDNLLSVFSGAGQFMFEDTKITSVRFPKLEYLEYNDTGYIEWQKSSPFEQMFSQCENLSSISFETLSSVGKNAFQEFLPALKNLEKVEFPNLEKFTGIGVFRRAFRSSQTPKLTSLTLPKWTGDIGAFASYINNGGIFYYCDGLSSIYLPSVTELNDAYAFQSCSKLTEIHFASTNQSTVESSVGYSTLWGRGAGNATVYFDL